MSHSRCLRLWIKKEDDPLNHPELVFRIIVFLNDDVLINYSGVPAKDYQLSGSAAFSIPPTTIVCITKASKPPLLTVNDTNTKDGLINIYCNPPKLHLVKKYRKIGER